MDCPFKIGDKVRCIANSTLDKDLPEQFGKVFTISNTNGQALAFKEIRAPGNRTNNEPYWSCTRFELVEDTKKVIKSRSKKSSDKGWGF